MFTGAAPENTSSAAKQPRILTLYPVAGIEGDHNKWSLKDLFRGLIADMTPAAVASILGPPKVIDDTIVPLGSGWGMQEAPLEAPLAGDVDVRQTQNRAGRLFNQNNTEVPTAPYAEGKRLRFVTT